MGERQKQYYFLHRVISIISIFIFPCNISLCATQSFNGAIFLKRMLCIVREFSTICTFLAPYVYFYNGFFIDIRSYQYMISDNKQDVYSVLKWATVNLLTGMLTRYSCPIMPPENKNNFEHAKK